MFVTYPTTARSKLGMILETYYSSIQKHYKSLYAKRSFQNCVSVSLNPKLHSKSLINELGEDKLRVFGGS
jgi:hypothetical protein